MDDGHSDSPNDPREYQDEDMSAEKSSPKPEDKDEAEKKAASQTDSFQKRFLFPTLFGEVKESNVCFCIDTSGSMVYAIDAVKEHLIETLQQMSQNNDKMFNLVEFSTDVQLWSDELVRCTPETVNVAIQWIKKLEAKTGTNTLDALLAAFRDNICEAVYLVTDGMPDSSTTDILNEVAYVANNRPVHCYFIQSDNSDESAVGFLQDLAMETYGSFHIIHVASRGTVERMTPVYRAEKSAEQIIRTNNGGVYSGTDKFCTVSATLDNVPEQVVVSPGVVVGSVPGYPVPTIVPGAPFTYYAYPHFRFYHNLPYFHPYLGWSRYRPAKAWMKHIEGVLDGAEGITWSPGAGSILIGKRVLARRNEDGLFYKGSVKSQLMDNQFLIEFGPCKHGKYRDTSYQETYVFDIVSYDDALRHSVLPDDKVLCPWQPEGEKYGPGVVLDGQERRTATGGTQMDIPLTVSMYNGQTVTVPMDTAVWVPSALFDRINFELKLPANVRQNMITQSEYPEKNTTGYPTSGPVAYPREWDQWRSITVDKSNGVDKTRALYKDPHYVPLYKLQTDYMDKSFVESTQSDVIPGTDWTTDKLKEKIQSQIAGYATDCSTTTCKTDEGYSTEATSEHSTMRKSVNFSDVDEATGLLKRDLTDQELLTEYLATEKKGDSGFGSSPDLTDLELEDLLRDAELDSSRRTESPTRAGSPKRCFSPTRRSAGSPLLKNRQRQSRSHLKKEPWKYWRNDPPPSLTDPLHYGPYRMGPYEEPVQEEQHIETRPSTAGIRGEEENVTSMSRFVNPLAITGLSQGNGTVGDCMYNPRPPDAPKPTASTAMHAHDTAQSSASAYNTMICNPTAYNTAMNAGNGGIRTATQHGGSYSTPNNFRVTVDIKNKNPDLDARMKYRSQQSAAREAAIKAKNESEIARATQIREWHREQKQQQIQRDHQRRQEEMGKIASQQEARRKVSEEINARMADNRQAEFHKHDDRLAALRNARYEREKATYMQNREKQQQAVNTQIAKTQQQQERVVRQNEAQVEEQARHQARAAQMQNAKLQRIEHFRELERQNCQSRNDLRVSLYQPPPANPNPPLSNPNPPQCCHH